MSGQGLAGTFLRFERRLPIVHKYSGYIEPLLHEQMGATKRIYATAKQNVSCTIGHRDVHCLSD